MLFAYFFLCKWVMPPITSKQLSFLVFESWREHKSLRRKYVPYDSISENVKLAVIASEDLHFSSHNGIDWNSIEAANRHNKQYPDSPKLGGSSIPQQVAKNVFLWNGRSYLRKLPEAGLALALNWAWGKQRILEVYLNVIEFGDGIYGIEAAAWHYFHKKSGKLTMDEAARLALCLPNPLKIDPLQQDPIFLSRVAKIKTLMNYLETDSLILDLIY